MPDLIPAEHADRILTRSARYPAFFGHWLVRYQLAETLLDETAVARVLGLDLRGMATLALCLVPRPASWDADLDTVARRVGLEPVNLASVRDRAGYRRPPTT